jgi:hypothetical protein
MRVMEVMKVLTSIICMTYITSITRNSASARGAA